MAFGRSGAHVRTKQDFSQNTGFRKENPTFRGYEGPRGARKCVFFFVIIDINIYIYIYIFRVFVIAYGFILGTFWIPFWFQFSLVFHVDFWTDFYPERVPHPHSGHNDRRRGHPVAGFVLK